MPPYTMSCSGRSATSGSRLFISIRSAASCCQPLHEISVPRGARIVRASGIAASKAIVEKHGGEVPRTMEELTALPGVGRKTANVVLGNAFNIAVGVVVDTHVTRVSGRLGLTSNVDAVKIEQDLMKLIPQKEWTVFSHRLIQHGRQICIARKPKCRECRLNELCPSAEEPLE